MEKGEECTSTRRPLFFVENSNYMDTPNVGDDEVVIDNDGVLLANDDDNVVVLERTPGNVSDGVSEPTSGNDGDGVSEPMPGNDDDDGVSEPTPGNDDGGVSEPTPEMYFKSEKDLIYYYKQYGRQAGFGIMTQRSKREDDGSVRYVTLGCARGGKARKRCIRFIVMNSIYSKSKPQATVATTVGSTHISIGAETESSKKVLSPRVVRGKGRPPSKRKQPTIEKLQTKNKNGGKRQRKNATSHNFQDVLNPADSVNQIGTPQIVPSQLLVTQQSVISQVNFEMHGPRDD